MNQSALIEKLGTSPLPWVRYNALKTFYNLPASDRQLRQSYRELCSHPLLQREITLCQQWPDPPLKSHKAAAHPLHHLPLLADLGCTVRTPGVKAVVDAVLNHAADDGALQSIVALPGIWGGSDTPEWLWMFCDAPVLLYACLALGVPENDKIISKAFDHLAQLATAKKWCCVSSLEKLSGPGRRTDPCPYATLLALRAFARSPRYTTGSICKGGTEVLLNHWDNRKKIKLRMFGIGTDFRKLKYPFIFYDILHVVEVLSHFSWVRKDKRFKEMLRSITSKRDQEGMIIPESVWMAFKGFDFAQKKEPSPMMTFLVERILQRCTQD